MKSYLALLRGINVGGNALIRMVDLKDAITEGGFNEVKTYIKSGNVIFKSDSDDIDNMAEKMEAVIETRFQLNVRVAIFSKDEWQKVIESAPTWWGKDKSWKHNLLILLRPYDMKDVVEAYGELKPTIENMKAGEGVLYQSLSFDKFGRTTGGKLASNPIYKKMTIRNYNTSTKLLSLVD